MDIMKSTIALLFTLTTLLFHLTTSHATTVGQELIRVAEEVSTLELGFKDYVLGGALSADQKEAGLKHTEEKALAGTYKFKDGDVFVIASLENDTVLGMYKEFENVGPEELKSIIGRLMFEYGEPTLTAHDKLIYWTYNKGGKISQETFDIERSKGGTKILATIKFSSKDRFGKPPEEGSDGQSTSAYLMISSDRMSQLFLARNQEAQK